MFQLDSGEDDDQSAIQMAMKVIPSHRKPKKDKDHLSKSDTTYFEDGIRKIDFVLVWEEGDDDAEDDDDDDDDDEANADSNQIQSMTKQEIRHEKWRISFLKHLQKKCNLEKSVSNKARTRSGQVKGGGGGGEYRS